jgi:hypothetical protein
MGQRFNDGVGEVAYPYLDAKGREVLDPTPMAPPIGYKRQPSMIDHIRSVVRREMSEAAARREMETFEEADDFEIGDDFDPSSPYEEIFEPAVSEPAAPVEAPPPKEDAPSEEKPAEVPPEPPKGE